jgi:predicted amidohydrolase
MSVRTALVQSDIVWEDPDASHARAAAHLAAAAAAGARFAVLPEMFACGFTMNADAVAEPQDGPTVRFLRDRARALALHVLAGVPLRSDDGGRPRNCAVLVRPDGEVRVQGKIHPFSFSDEDRHYAASDLVQTWDVLGLRVTPFVCYDLRFPEPFRLAADDTDAYVVIASWPERRAAHWRTLLAARAIENQAYVLGENRVGEGGGLSYRGDSVALDPWGEPLVSAAVREAVLVTDLDPAAVIQARASFPPLRDRKPVRRA